MDCDQVFMILTRGPFPTGAPTDEQVEEHLETCGDCWRLAEALRPALELFQEAVPPIESRDLPGYWGEARPAAATLAQRTGTAARVARMVNVRPAATGRQPQPIAPLETSLASEVLPAIVMMSILMAAVASLVMWLRG